MKKAVLWGTVLFSMSASIYSGPFLGKLNSAVAYSQDQEQEQEPDPNPPQPGDTTTHRYSPGDGCSSVDPDKAGEEFDGVRPNTVGCGCAPTCVNGQRVEDRTKDKNNRYICKNACHVDRCFCSDPCKS